MYTRIIYYRRNIRREGEKNNNNNNNVTFNLARYFFTIQMCTELFISVNNNIIIIIINYCTERINIRVS